MAAVDKPQLCIGGSDHNGGLRAVEFETVLLVKSKGVVIAFQNPDGDGAELCQLFRWMQPLASASSMVMGRIFSILSRLFS